MFRGLMGRCPACGRGRCLTGYIRPVGQCASCTEDLAPYQTADFAPYVVTFVIGLIYTPLALVFALRDSPENWPLVVILAAAVVTALLLLPRVKGAFIGLLWAMRVHNT